MTIPIPTLPLLDSDAIYANDVEAVWEPYSIGVQFRSSLVSKGLEESRIVNLNLLLPLVGVIVSRHRRIVGQANVRGPFYVKARIENVWRAVPFIDLSEYMTHIDRFDFPVMQVSNMMVPIGTSLDTFVVSPELENIPAESERITFDGPIEMWLEIMQAFGLPHELLAKNAKALLSVSIQESEMHRARLYSE